MKKCFPLVVFALLGLVLVSCTDKPFLDVKLTTLSFDAEGGRYALSFSANDVWSAASDVSWCSVSPARGDASDVNEASLTVTCDPNTSFEDRSCTLTITCAGLSHTIQLSQSKNDGLLVSQSTYDLTNDAQTISIEVKANVDYAYTIESGCTDWVKASSTKGLTANILLFDIAKNDDYDPREGKITFTQKNGQITREVIIRQGQQDGLFVSTPEYDLSNESHVLTVAVKANVSFEVESQSEWINLIETKGLQSSQIILDVAENDTFGPREGTVVVKQTNGSLRGTITVRQKENQGLYVSKKSFELSNKAQTIEVTVKSAVDFDIVIPDDAKHWIKVVDTKTMSSTITFSIEKNDYDDRHGSVTIKQKQGPLCETISISQAQTNAIILAEKEYLLSAESQTLVLDIQSNVDYSIVLWPEWITQIGTKSLNTKTLQFAIEENPSLSVREGFITFLADNITQVVSIKQLPKQIRALPHFNEGIELMWLIWRLAGNSNYHFETYSIPSINESVNAYFANMKNHAAVSLAKSLAYEYGIGHDAVDAFGLHLDISEQGIISFSQDFSEGGDSSFDRWPEQEKQVMLAAVNDFYRQSNFHEWYQSLEPMRQQALNLFNKVNSIDYEWFGSFFGPMENLSSQIVLSFLMGNGNHGLSADLVNGKKLLSPVISIFQMSSSGVNEGYMNLETLVHEFCHPFCNPLIDKYWNSIVDKANAIFNNVVNHQMLSVGYTNPVIMMYETLVRSCTIRYLMTHGYEQYKEYFIQYDESYGFMLVRMLVDVLEKREQQQAQYATLDDFMPAIIKAINDYQL